MEADKKNIQPSKEDKVIDKSQSKSFSVKDLNEKVKQKTSILEFNLKKDYEFKLKEQTELIKTDLEKNKLTFERTTDQKLKKQIQDTEKKLISDFESRMSKRMSELEEEYSQLKSSVRAEVESKV